MYDVAVPVGNDFLPGRSMRHDCKLVAHCAGYHKQRGFLAHPPGSHCFQLVDGWVIAIYIIPHNGILHGLPHGHGGLCYRIAP